MQHTEEELELAKKYTRGEYTEVQFNYLIFKNNLDKNKMHELVLYIEGLEPVTTIIIKLLLAYMGFHFLFCIAYSLWQYYKV
jgi:hypothetical protein